MVPFFPSDSCPWPLRCRDTDERDRMDWVVGPAGDLYSVFSEPSDRSTEPIALVRKGEEGVCSGGWNCLSQGQQVGILFTVILVTVSLILAMAYYCHNRKNQGWTDDDENIIPMRPIQRKKPDKKLGRSPSIVSRHTSYGLPTIPGVQPPPYNVIVLPSQPTVYSYIQVPNPILLPAPPMHVSQPTLVPVQSNQGTAALAMPVMIFSLPATLAKFEGPQDQMQMRATPLVSRLKKCRVAEYNQEET
ncbi:hypothetical protein ACRALDRAFT_1072536 [Sodiomyces alcalophilus JCM 7366]|uniref:uncharacterized protein n=1 Tax=Sodiomyces alcalophilus JCM 7366 TaxID=591952 RepID=UPI0039B646A3